MANLLLIRDLCQQKKITIRELAHRINRDESSLQCAIRKGSTNTATLEAIAQVLEVSPGVFYDDYLDTNEAKLIKQENEYLKKLLIEKERLIEKLMQ